MGNPLSFAVRQKDVGFLQGGFSLAVQFVFLTWKERP